MLEGKDLLWIKQDYDPDDTYYWISTADAQAHYINYEAERNGYMVRFDEMLKRFVITTDDEDPKARFIIAFVSYHRSIKEWEAELHSVSSISLKDIKIINMVFEAIEMMGGTRISWRFPN